MSVDDETWAEIRRLYLADDMTVSAIAKQFGISQGRIYARAKEHDWPRRSMRGRKPVSNRRTKRSGGTTHFRQPTGDDATYVVQTAVVRRLYGAIDAKLKRLEARMAKGAELSAADSERETRELGTMIRSFERVTEFAADIDKARTVSTGRDKPVTAADAEQMREEIAQRLERLHIGDVGSRDAGTPDRR